MNKIASVFFFMMFVIGTDIFIASPLLPTLRTAFDISVESSGWIVSAYAFGYAVFALIAGPLSDGWNRKKVMIVGMSSFGLFTLLCGFAADLWTMLLFRFLAGVSAAFASPQIWAAIPQLVSPDKILKAMGVASAGLGVSQMLGVPIGSYLAGFGWRTPFIVIGASAFVIVILIAVLLPAIPAALSKENSKEKAPSIIERYRTLLRGFRPQIAFLAYFIFQLGNFATLSFMGTWLSDRFGLNVTSVGTVILFFGIGSVLSSFFSSRLVHKLGHKLSFVIVMALLVILYAGLPFLSNLTSVKVMYFLIYFFLGTIFPLMMSSLQTLSSTARGTISSLANSSMYFGATAGSSVAGILYANMSGFVSVSFFTALCFIVSLLSFLRSGVLPGRQQARQ